MSIRASGPSIVSFSITPTWTPAITTAAPAASREPSRNLA
jgi:hypothetical protein